MTFLAILRRELLDTWRQFLFFAVISGIANAAVLATINQAAASATATNAILAPLFVFGLAILLYTVSQRALMQNASGLAEATVLNLRARFVEALQTADLAEVERLNRSALYGCISSEMQVISDGALNLVIIAQAAILVIMTTVYLAWLSLPALLLASVFIAVAASFHIARTRQISERMTDTFTTSTALLDGFTDFVEGVKEVKLNSARSAHIASYIRGLSSDVSHHRLEIRELFTTDFVASQVTFFLLTGTMAFLVPMVTDTDRTTITKVTASVLFLIGPISAVVGSLPVLQRVNAAAEAIISVEAQIAQLKREPEPIPSVQPPPFEQLALRAVTFNYDGALGEGGFRVGPIDLEVRRGDVVFITGGNGSGKSTLLKLLTGLYLPENGHVELNGGPVGDAGVTAYRNLFSAIFSDNHLFRQLYGIPQMDPAKAHEYLALMEIEGKVQIVNHSFTTIALSSGQRKRLAMVALLLEDRPVCVFDEWAADQDPQFRRRFYREIIPMLKQRNKTIVAVTHDEQYFDAADFQVRLEEGQLRPRTNEPLPQT